MRETVIFCRPKGPFSSYNLILKHIFRKVTERQQEEWTSYGASVPALIVVLYKFTSRWLCQYFRIAGITVLDGQSPAKAWSALLRNEASKSFPRNAVRRTSIVNNRQRFAKESALFCIWLPPNNGTACFPFRNYFQPFDHNAQNSRNNGKAVKLPKVKLNFARRSFYFMGASIHCH